MKRFIFSSCLVLTFFIQLSFAQKSKEAGLENTNRPVHFVFGLSPQSVFHGNKYMYQDGEIFLGTGIEGGVSLNQTGKYFSLFAGAGPIIKIYSNYVFIPGNESPHKSHLNQVMKQFLIPPVYDNVDYYVSDDRLNFRHIAFRLYSGVKLFYQEYSRQWPNFYIALNGTWMVLPVKEEVTYTANAWNSQTYESAQFNKDIEYSSTQQYVIPHIQIGCELPHGNSKMIDLGIQAGGETHRTVAFSLYLLLK